MITPESSYATVHWPITGNHELINDSPDLESVARLEGDLRAHANRYAEANNFDYACRIVLAGADVVDAAIRALERQRPSSTDKQAYEYAQDRSYLPRGIFNAHAPKDDLGTQIPEPVLTVLNNL